MPKLSKITQLIKRKMRFGEPNWNDPENLHDDWENRVHLMASLISYEGVVADIGCGKMKLNNHLDANRNTYLPVDYVKRTDESILFDGNKQAFPNLNASVIFISGMIEYLNNPLKFLCEVHETQPKQIILSYVSLELRPNKIDRRRMGWKNNLRVHEIIEALISNYSLDNLLNFNGNHIFSFKHKTK